MSMPSDYINRDEFHTTLNLRILELRREIRLFMSEQRKQFEGFVVEQRKAFEALVTEQRKEFERYTGAMKEHFQGGIETIVEGVNMNTEKTERLERSSQKEFDDVDRRLSQIEMTRARRRLLKDQDDKRRQNKKRKNKPLL